jgi:hypothetical protein
VKVAKGKGDFTWPSNTHGQSPTQQNGNTATRRCITHARYCLLAYASNNGDGDEEEDGGIGDEESRGNEDEEESGDENE